MSTASDDSFFLEAVDDVGVLRTNIMEQADDILNWFEKNGAQLVANDNLSENLLSSHKPDPLLNQINVRESPTLLHLSDNESDQLTEFTLSAITNASDSYLMESTNFTTMKTDKNMNSLAKENNPTTSTSMTKFQQLEYHMKSSISWIVNKSGMKLHISFRGEDGRDILPHHIISSKEIGGNMVLNQPVALVENVLIAETLDVRMPCLHGQFGMRMWLCPVADCHKAFCSFQLVRLHASMHLNLKPFICQYPECKWAFFTSFKLRRHQETHSNRKDFVCPVPDCARRFTTIYNLKCHRRRHEKPADIPCLVETCKQTFQNLRACELHLKTHGNSEAPYRCHAENCNKSFFSNTALITHAKVHSHKESEVRCQWPNCGRVFNQPCRLREHSRNHTGLRPFSCTYSECNWAFSTSSKLKRHLSTHTNDRKFHCTIGSCKKSFLRSQHLKEHTLTHMGVRPYICIECNATFACKSRLHLHVKKNHRKSNCPSATIQMEDSLEKPTSDMLLEQAIQSLGVPSDMVLGTGLLPEEPLELLTSEKFSTVNLRDLD